MTYRPSSAAIRPAPHRPAPPRPATLPRGEGDPLGEGACLDCRCGRGLERREGGRARRRQPPTRKYLNGSPDQPLPVSIKFGIKRKQKKSHKSVTRRSLTVHYSVSRDVAARGRGKHTLECYLCLLRCLCVGAVVKSSLVTSRVS